MTFTAEEGTEFSVHLPRTAAKLPEQKTETKALSNSHAAVLAP